jgi:hypothetical protein
MPVGPPHWVVFRESEELDEEGVAELLRRVGYAYPRKTLDVYAIEIGGSDEPTEN